MLCSGLSGSFLPRYAGNGGKAAALRICLRFRCRVEQLPPELQQSERFFALARRQWRQQQRLWPDLSLRLRLVEQLPPGQQSERLFFALAAMAGSNSGFGADPVSARLAAG